MMHRFIKELKLSMNSCFSDRQFHQNTLVKKAFNYSLVLFLCLQAPFFTYGEITLTAITTKCTVNTYCKCETFTCVFHKFC